MLKQVVLEVFLNFSMSKSSESYHRFIQKLVQYNTAKTTED